MTDFSQQLAKRIGFLSQGSCLVTLDIQDAKPDGHGTYHVVGQKHGRGIDSSIYINPAQARSIRRNHWTSNIDRRLAL